MNVLSFFKINILSFMCSWFNINIQNYRRYDHSKWLPFVTTHTAVYVSACAQGWMGSSSSIIIQSDHSPLSDPQRPNHTWLYVLMPDLWNRSRLTLNKRITLLFVKLALFSILLLACSQRKGDNGSVICFIYSNCSLSIYYSIASPVSFKWHPSSMSLKM